jgi:hypothetical protein
MEKITAEESEHLVVIVIMTTVILPMPHFALREHIFSKQVVFNFRCHACPYCAVYRWFKVISWSV